MPLAVSTRSAKDGGGTLFPGNMRMFDLSAAGDGTGPWIGGHVLVDGAAGSNRQTVDAHGSAQGLLFDAAGAEVLGQVTASPAANTIGDRLKTLNSSLSDKSQFTKITDGTNTATVKAGLSGPPAATDPALAVTIRDANSNGQATAANSAPVVFASDKGLQSQNFAAAATQLVRPANITAYSVNDSISNNATAGSVTALSATVSDTNDYPVNLTHITLDTNDTGIGAATTSIRVYVYNADPTASTGVGAGDNAAFSNKKNGLVATFTGTFIALSDGGKAVCTPESGAPYLSCFPTSGAKTLFVQHQIIAGTPTPSANSTTIDTKLHGFQGRP